MSVTPVSEERILAALHRLPSDQWSRVLEFLDSLQEVQQANGPAKRWTPAELLKLPLHLRDAILAEQAAAAEQEYRSNPELTAFDAFGEDDLYGESADTQTR